MNRTQRICVILLSFLLITAITACSEEKPDTLLGDADWVWVRDLRTVGALSDTGFYYVANNVLRYADLKEEASTVLCANAGCNHDSQACDAYILAGNMKPMYYLDKNIYYFAGKQPTLYRRDETGAKMVEVGTIGQKYMKEKKSVQIGNCVAAAGYLYYEADIFDNAVEADGNTKTQLTMEIIGRIHLTTGIDEILLEEPCDRYSENLILCAVRENDVLINHWEGVDKDLDLMDPNEREESLKNTIAVKHWNIETAHMTTLFHKTINECSRIVLVDDGKVYYKALGNINSDISGYLYSYDLATGKDELAIEANTPYQMGGGYALCKKKSGDFFIYDLLNKKELPHELHDLGYVLNVSEHGCVLLWNGELRKENAEDEYGYATVFYSYVPYASLTDGLQEEDLITLFTEEYMSS